MYRRTALFSFIALSWAALAAPAWSQTWGAVDTEGGPGAGAFVCASPSETDPQPPCFRLTCENDAPLHYEITLFGEAAAGIPEEIAVEMRVDGRASGLLLFQRGAEGDGMIELSAPFDPRLHGELVAQLRRGTAAELVLQHPEGARATALSLRGSSKTLGAVMDACPMPEVPLNDPAAIVLDQIVRECGALGGSVAMEPGFERREDLDGDGRDDVVIDYAAAVCSEMASLYCGSGGCTVGFFLSRDDAFKRIFDGVIRGYTVKPGGLLALDLHGTACGLYGFEACRKVFRISDASFALVEEIAGAAAEAAQTADRDLLPSDADAPEASPPARENTATDAPAMSPSAAPEADRRDAAGDPTEGREWLGDGGALHRPLAGERLPDDLDPQSPETPTPADSAAE